MSGVAIAAAVLGGDAATLALVPATSMKRGLLAKGSNPPLILLTTISRVPLQSLKDGRRSGRTRVRVTVRASTYDQLEAILSAVRECLGDFIGAIAGCTGISVLVDVEGPDFTDPTNGVLERSQDFRITFTAAG